MKEVTELKDGMKVWIPFEVRTRKTNVDFPFHLFNVGVYLNTTKDCRFNIGDPPIEIYEQEEIPLLTPVGMEVSDTGVKWAKTKVVCKIGNLYMDILGVAWQHARPIQKTVTLEIPESELTDELRKYLK